MKTNIPKGFLTAAALMLGAALIGGMRHASG